MHPRPADCLVAGIEDHVEPSAIGRLVLREPHIPVDPPQRPVQLRHRLQGRVERRHPVCQGRDHVQRRGLQMVIVPRPVRLEPVLAVIALQILQEPERLFRECHILPSAGPLCLTQGRAPNPIFDMDPAVLLCHH